ncbi:MAG: glycine--tRNA ligase [Sulfolobales archaeon]|nr:glycine--tRNA ligase [Sulfolobales archaeon]MCX8185538.1 glycine--tRNA ligase [Sulfolobales archaeon]MDW7969983.1 glycine--tRNA ligase [Sulfolobales archaeon]
MDVADKYDKVVELAKRRGFFWPSYEVYGGVAGLYDLGPLGAVLKNRIVDKWREWFVGKHQDIVVEIETPVITPYKVLEASGHVRHFTDPIVECMKCGRKFRADQLVEEHAGIKVEGMSIDEINKVIGEKGVRCPTCGGGLSDVRLFNLLFTTTIGPYSQDVGYLRPESAQGIFTAFKRVYEAFRERLPLGIAQIGKVARNEISPRQGMVRLREFTIMEVEFFFDPENPSCDLLDRCDGKLRLLTSDLRVKGVDKPVELSAKEAVESEVIKTPWMAYWMWVAKNFIKSLGIPEDHTYFEEKLPHEKAHYSAQTFDQLVRISRWGWIEVSGHAYRTDYDLSMHMKHSGQDFRVFKKYDQPTIARVEKVLINKALIGKVFKERSTDVINAVSSVGADVLKTLLKTDDEYIRIGEYLIPKNAVTVQEVIEKVSGKHIVPHVVEPSFGAERLLLIVLDNSYSEEDGRVVMKLPRDLAPIQVAVYPLVSDDVLEQKAKQIYEELKSCGLYVVYDDSGSIGRRYARADEVGVPIAVTVDHQTLDDSTVTLRDRDSKAQIRVREEEIVQKVLMFLRSSVAITQL